MSDKDINVAIAAECGWTCINSSGDLSVGFNLKLKGPAVSCLDAVPNYTEDLNAMREAEKALPDLQKYRETLCIVTAGNGGPITATARQRAEAFLKTLGKWKD